MSQHHYTWITKKRELVRQKEMYGKQMYVFKITSQDAEGKEHVGEYLSSKESPNYFKEGEMQEFDAVAPKQEGYAWTFKPVKKEYTGGGKKGGGYNQKTKQDFQTMLMRYTADIVIASWSGENRTEAPTLTYNDIPAVFKKMNEILFPEDY